MSKGETMRDLTGERVRFSGNQVILDGCPIGSIRDGNSEDGYTIVTVTGERYICDAPKDDDWGWTVLERE